MYIYIKAEARREMDTKDSFWCKIKLVDIDKTSIKIIVIIKQEKAMKRIQR